MAQPNCLRVWVLAMVPETLKLCLKQEGSCIISPTAVNDLIHVLTAARCQRTRLLQKSEEYSKMPEQWHLWHPLQTLCQLPLVLLDHLAQLDLVQL